MQKAPINKLKEVLVERQKTGKWLAMKLNVTETTVSRWCTNDVQPSLATLREIAQFLDVDIKDLIYSTKF